MTWVGLDLHKRYITACALDDAGVIVAEHRRLPADDVALIGWLAALARARNGGDGSDAVLGVAA